MDMLLRHGLHFAISIVLARLLSPDDFGTIALLYMFTGIASIFLEGGFSSALIQRQDITHIDESTVFWLNLSIGTLFAIGLWSIASPLATFYGRSELEPLAGLMALNILVSTIGSIHSTLLTKKLDFRTQMKTSSISSVLSGGVAITMAWQGAGLWALAAHAFTATLITTILLWWINPWRPLLKFSMASVHKLFLVGGYLLASGLLGVLVDRMHTLIIGKFYGVRELGYYNRADGTKQLPLGLLTGIISRVALPIFSAAADDKEQLRRGVKQSVQMAMLINIPIMFGLFAVSKPLVLVLFGESWRPAVPILQVLCLAGIFWPLHILNLNALIAQGHSSLFFRLEIGKRILGIALLIAGAYNGVMGIAWSQVVFGVVAFFINAYYTKRYLNYGAFDQIMDFLPAFVLALFCFGGGLFPLINFLDERILVSIFCGILTASIFALSAWFIKLPGVLEIKRLINFRGKINDVR